MSRIDRDRRKFLAAGSTAAAISLAGCSSVVLNRLGGDGDGGGEEENGGDGGDGGGSERGENVPEEVHTFLTDNSAKLYEGTAADETGSDEVTVAVGAGDSGVAFDPPAVLVDSGTTVTWEWTGEGGAHNVESADSSAAEFRSGNAQNGADITHSETFESGNQLYYCSPHQAVGMYGAVIVSGDGGME